MVRSHITAPRDPCICRATARPSGLSPTRTPTSVGSSARQIVEKWVAEMRRDHLWRIDDPLFPSTAIGQDSDRRFAATGLARTHWASADAVQKIFKQSFEAIGLHGFNPHNFRHALAVLGEKICRTPEKFCASCEPLHTTKGCSR
jgi:integrase